jgi:hypothetical protein
MIFILSLQDLLGDNNLVNLIEDWDVLAEYAGEKIGFYQLIAVDGQFEIRVLTGRCGFVREFSSSEDPLFSKIMDFVRRHRYVQVSLKIRDEEFFK